MTGPPRRKRFQFHLSTAIVMMFVAGGLIWANVTERANLEWGVYGFPIDAAYWHDGWLLQPIVSGIIVNFVSACGLLLAVWFYCEWLIRRRAVRK